MQALQGCVALVTGASRGIGKGIALELGAAGATVYVTGRTVAADGAASLPGSLDETVEEIGRLGGTGVGVGCDHGDDEQVRCVMARINADHGHLDVLVNNVFSSPDLKPWLGRPFWELPLEAWDQMFDIGVRSHYVASALAVPMMLGGEPSLIGDGRLIVNVSAPGAKQYRHNAVYGVGKAALDRMTADTARELAPHNVTVVSIWPGLVQTEFVLQGADEHRKISLPEGQLDLSLAETPRFSGRAVVALATDALRQGRSGGAYRVSDLADTYGFTDVDGRIPNIHRAGD